MTPGRHISIGSIIAMWWVLTKDLSEYSIIAGNPARVVKENEE